MKNQNVDLLRDHHLITFSGRPNAGKSSLILYFISKTTAKKYKIRVGKTPGTTTRINLIPLCNNLTLVDLPGFGKLHRKGKHFEEKTKDKIIEFFEKYGAQILFSLHIIDLYTFEQQVKSLERKNIIPIDQEMVEFLLEVTDKPVFVVANKIDRLSALELQKQMKLLLQYMPEEVEIFYVSCRTKYGINDLKKRMKALIKKNPKLPDRYLNCF